MFGTGKPIAVIIPVSFILWQSLDRFAIDQCHDDAHRLAIAISDVRTRRDPIRRTVERAAATATRAVP